MTSKTERIRKIEKNQKIKGLRGYVYYKVWCRYIYIYTYTEGGIFEAIVSPGSFLYLYIFKEATPHSAGPGVAIIITVSKEELRTWEGGF